MKVLHCEDRSLLVHNPEIDTVIDGACNEELVVDCIDCVGRMLLVPVDQLTVFVNLPEDDLSV